MYLGIYIKMFFKVTYFLTLIDLCVLLGNFLMDFSEHTGDF